MPETGVRLNPEIVRFAEIALQIGASCTKASKLPVAGLGVTGVEVPQLVSIPATRAIPSNFADVKLNIRLKGLLLFTVGIGDRPRGLPLQAIRSAAVAAPAKDPCLFLR